MCPGGKYLFLMSSFHFSTLSLSATFLLLVARWLQQCQVSCQIPAWLREEERLTHFFWLSPMNETLFSAAPQQTFPHLSLAIDGCPYLLQFLQGNWDSSLTSPTCLQSWGEGYPLKHTVACTGGLLSISGALLGCKRGKCC